MQPIESWNISNINSLNSMFYSASAFNQPIGTWNTTLITDMSYMFQNATAFNQNISGWNVSGLTTRPPTDFIRNATSLALENQLIWYKIALDDKWPYRKIQRLYFLHKWHKFPTNQ